MSQFLKRFFKPPDLVWFARNLGILSLRQWNCQASLRFRRLCQLMEFYKQLYNERTIRGLLRNFNRRFGVRVPSRINRTLFTAAVGFCFKDQGIGDDEMKRTEEMIHELDKEECPHTKRTKLGFKAQADSEWDLILERHDFAVWRRPLAGHPYLCEYKCAGTYTDISASSFFVAQMDLDYRKQWDNMVISLDVVDSDGDTKSETVHWITHFPYPMYPREYVYVRRAWVNSSEKVMVLNAKAAEHPKFPVTSEFVRVDVYSAQMVIRPHKDFKNAGFDYVLTYCDDPKSAFPTVAYKWMVKHGLPGFLDKVYHAAKAFEQGDFPYKTQIDASNYIQQFTKSNSQQKRLVMTY